jgi:hypothetical protein
MNVVDCVRPLTSSEGERALLGTFRVTVRDGKVAKAVGLDESARRVVRDLREQVPTLGGLLEQLEQARRDGAMDDEELYVISAYE